MSRCNIEIGKYRECEFKGSDGSRALIVLTVTADQDYESFGHKTEYEIDPALAEVWPCVGCFWGHLAYAQEALRGEGLQTWLDKYRDDLISLAWDVSADEAERHDEEMAERL